MGLKSLLALINGMTQSSGEEAVIQAMSTQLAAANGSRSSRKKHSDKPVNKCEQYKQLTSKIESDLTKNKCDNYSTLPESRNCEALGKVEKVTHMYVDRLRFKIASRVSGGLLPNGSAYSDTNLFLKIVVDKLEVPYDPPEGGGTPSTAMIDLVLDIRAASQDSQKNIMQLEADVNKSKISPMTSN